jgi:hypothetical protein
MNRPSAPPSLADVAPVRIAKTDVEEVRVEWSEFSGHRFLNARTCYTPDDGATWLHTQRGITIRPADFPTFMAGLHRLAQAAIEGGWLDAEDFEAAQEDQPGSERQHHKSAPSHPAPVRARPRDYESGSRRQSAASNPVIGSAGSEGGADEPR